MLERNHEDEFGCHNIPEFSRTFTGFRAVVRESIVLLKEHALIVQPLTTCYTSEYHNLRQVGRPNVFGYKMPAKK